MPDTVKWMSESEILIGHLRRSNNVASLNAANYIEKLEQENARLKVALNWYAREENWEREIGRPYATRYNGALGEHGYGLAQRALKGD